MNIKLLDSKELKDSLTVSAVEFLDEQLYLFRYDQHDIVVLDKNWKIKDTISLAQAEPEIPDQNQQVDYKASAIIQLDEIPFLLFLGSGSLEIGQNTGLLMNLQTKSVEELDLSVFYNRLKELGLENLNIQAVTILHDKLILSNNGNKDIPGNHFIITTIDFWKNQPDAEITIERIEWEENPGKSMTIYGLTYSNKNDWLIVSVVPEDIDKSGNEATSGDNYLAVIENALRKTIRKKIKLTDPVNLPKNNKAFRGYKIKFHCLQSEKDGRVKLLLLGSSEKGKSSLFKIRIKE